MKNIIFLFILTSFSFANQYTFLVDKYDKETELEAKIIYKIAKATTKDDLKLYIPQITKSEKYIYSKIFKIVNDCTNANFIYVKNNYKIDYLCDNNVNKKIFFTNNYRRLLKDDRYLGAFFWNKSRPNITFIKDRLSKNNIKLSFEFKKFIEDIK